MGELVLQLLAWLRELFPPFKIINADEQGSKWSFGRPAGTLKAGIHWYLPYFQTITIHNVVYQQIDLPVQTVPTKDGTEVSFSANVGYVITDAQAMELGVQDFDHTLARAAAGWLATKLGEETYERARGERKQLQQELKRSLANLVKEWGVEVKDVRLTDFCKTRQYRLFSG